MSTVTIWSCNPLAGIEVFHTWFEGVGVWVADALVEL
jgi:hypothetical protein